MTKRILALMLALVMLLSVVFTLAACNDDDWDEDYSDEDDDDDDDEDEDKDDEDDDDDDEDDDDEDDDDDHKQPSGLSFDANEEVTITFYHTMGTRNQNILNAYIAEFNRLYPNITIVHENMGGYADVFQSISVEITVGTQPNIAYCYPEHVATYNLAGAVVPLDDLMNCNTEITNGNGEIIGLTQEQKDDFIDSFMESGRVYGDDLTYTMPLTRSTEALFYNKSFFDAYGLEVPTTWSEMATVCQQILEIDPNCVPLGIDDESNLFINMCEQLGSGYTSATGDHCQFDNPTNQSLVAMLRDWYQVGYLTTENLIGSYTSNLFIEQGCYMSIGSTAGAVYYDGSSEVGIAAIPQWNPSNPKSISQGPSLCVLQSSDTTDAELIASWLFVKFLCTNVSFQAEFSMNTGYMPVLKSVVDNPVYSAWLNSGNGFNNLTALAVGVGLENMDSCFTSPAFSGSAEIRENVGMLVWECLLITGDDVSSQINSIFKKYSY